MNPKTTATKKVFFASDFHLGIKDKLEKHAHEKRIVAWLESIRNEAEAIWLVGDIFDFWFEYDKVIPKGFSRFLGKIAEMHDEGIHIYIYTGNHDVWMFDYFQKEMDIPVYYKERSVDIRGKKFFMAHGDGIEKGTSTYKILKSVFTSKLCQWLFARIHPNLGISLAQKWSVSSRNNHNRKGMKYFGKKEHAYLYAKEIEEKKHHDYYIFGHRHKPMHLDITKNSDFICLGDWIDHFTYAVFDGNSLELRQFMGQGEDQVWKE